MTTTIEPVERRGKRPPQGDAVIARAFQILRCFDARRSRMTVGQMSRHSGIPSSSAQRLANQLVEAGALERDDDGRYHVGLRLYEVATLTPLDLGLRRRALPYMGELASATHQHVLLAVLDGAEAVLVERISPQTAPKVLYRVGGRLPLHATAAGLVLLAHAPAVVQDEYLRWPLAREPEQTVVAPDELRRVLAAVRGEHVATLRREVGRLFTAVAAPVTDTSGAVVAAVSVVSGEAEENGCALVAAVRACALSISRVLHGARPGAR